MFSPSTTAKVVFGSKYVNSKRILFNWCDLVVNIACKFFSDNRWIPSQWLCARGVARRRPPPTSICIRGGKKKNQNCKTTIGVSPSQRLCRGGDSWKRQPPDIQLASKLEVGEQLKKKYRKTTMGVYKSRSWSWAFTRICTPLFLELRYMTASSSALLNLHFHKLIFWINCGFVIGDSHKNLVDSDQYIIGIYTAYQHTDYQRWLVVWINAELEYKPDVLNK